MKPRRPNQAVLQVRRCDVAAGAGVWCITRSNLPIDGGGDQERAELAARTFTDHPDAASVSFVRSSARQAKADQWRALAPLADRWFFNERVRDLVGFTIDDTPRGVAQAEVDRWIAAANARGLAHLWRLENERRDQRESPTAAVAAVVRPAAPRSGLTVGIDAAWLMAGESGAQVFVFEMLLALVARAEIVRVILLSQQGTVPARLRGAPKIEALTWADAMASPGPLVDVLHRPYQPDASVDFAHYRRVGRCVVLTVLDFIAYDIPTYHESPRAWRRHRARFDEHIELADAVFAISQSVAHRVDSQYAGRLSRPARAIELGTDHLDRDAGETAIPPALGGLSDQPFLAVLGNDFAHKNRDFAVRVFAALCDRGYQGQLVLAGFHLDLGSSYGYEMSGAGPHASRVSRLGTVTAAERNWLLRTADVVLYPTSAEGFGLIPFEAAALGTPTAFVRFRPLAETMPSVDACDAWQVGRFADLVERLCRDPKPQVDSIREAAGRLTWDGHAARSVDAYRELLDDGSEHRRRALPGPSQQAWRAASDFVDRLTAAVARRASRAFRFQSALHREIP